MKCIRKHKYDQGIATLAVVASVALIALLIVLGVSRRAVNDIQQTQARVKTEQSLSKAWAALDCAVAKIQHDGIELSNDDIAQALEQLSPCQNVAQSQLWLAPWQNSKRGMWHLYATHAQQQVGVTLAKATGARRSSFVTSGSAAFYGGNTWRPVKGKKREDGLYECHSIMAGGDVMIRPRTLGENQSKSSESSESSKNEEEKSQNRFTVRLDGSDECAPEYKTEVSDYTVADSRDETGARLKKDVQTNVENMDLFNDYFGVPRAQWETVREQFERQGGFVVNTQDDPSLCYETLLNAVASSKHRERANAKVWVDGPCDLSREGLKALPSEPPILLVVQDGIVALRGAIKPFKGVVYQFNTDNLNAREFAEQWGMTISESGGMSCSHDDSNIQELCEMITSTVTNPDQASRVPFWFHGSFITKGAFITDVPDGHSVVYGSFQPTYSDETVQQSFKGLKQWRPVGNSYHDIKPPYEEG
ncbi:hypothetical protein [Salinivibrio sp. MA607]|uniref:hypothetical protein n=1 Tax=Salinivibrio sp. MA607 TaxID=1909457 RepID=UPI0009D3ED32|nr:hypothetical protein [Salinivibrio sp. MA607]OOF02193.1 hypothetical protein BZG81_14870 [Salinivibrio sp. MA607]